MVRLTVILLLMSADRMFAAASTPFSNAAVGLSALTNSRLNVAPPLPPSFSVTVV
jgi:hypothetical protein